MIEIDGQYMDGVIVNLVSENILRTPEPVHLHSCMGVSISIVVFTGTWAPSRLGFYLGYVNLIREPDVDKSCDVSATFSLIHLNLIQA